MTQKVVVFGSINLDLVTKVQTHPVPGETVYGEDYLKLPGGKGGNQALAAARIARKSNDVSMIGAVGKDEFAALSIKNLKASGINLDHLHKVDIGTGIAMIAVAKDGENTIIVCPGANAMVSATLIHPIKFTKGDILLTQQELPLVEIWRAHAYAKQAGAVVVHNAAPANQMPANVFENIDYLIVNESEARAIARDIGGKNSPIEDAAIKIAQLHSTNVILTLGSKGAVGILQGSIQRISAPPANVVDTTGAGDVFCGTFAACLAIGYSPAKALETSIAKASQACEWFGAQQEIL